MRPILLLSITAVLVHARPAAACECGLPVGPISPASGATAVPTNAVVFFDTGLAPVTQIALSAGGQNIAVTLEAHDGFVIARPGAPLAANTTYDVSALQAGQTMHSTFTTGATADTIPPTAPGLTAIAPETMQRPSSTGSQGCVACDVVYANDEISRIRFDVPPISPDAVLLDIHVVIAGDSSGEQDIAVRPEYFTDHVLGFHICGPIAPALTTGVEYCAQIFAYDAAGNIATDPNHQACAPAVGCTPMLDTTTCEPADACVPLVGPGSGSDAGTRPGDPAPTASHPGGCATSTGAGLALLAIALAPVLRRRRR